MPWEGQQNKVGCDVCEQSLFPNPHPPAQWCDAKHTAWACKVSEISHKKKVIDCTIPCFVHHIMAFHRISVSHRDGFFDRKAVRSMSPFDYRGVLLYGPCLSPWYLFFSKRTPPCRRVYSPPPGRHAMCCLNVIGRDGWVRDIKVWAKLNSHGVGVGYLSAVWPKAGLNSDRHFMISL